MRRRLLPLLVVLVLLGAALSGLWYWADGLALRQWDAQVAALRAQGIGLESGPPVRAGFPVALGLDVPDVRVELPEGEVPGGATWRAERLAVRVEATHPGTLLLRPGGAQSIRLGGLPPVPYEAEALQVAVPLDGGDAVLRARALRSAGPLPVLLGGVEARLGAAALRFDAETVELPGTSLSPGGPVSLDAALTTPLPPPSPDPLRRLAAWRDAGGAVVLRRLLLRWGNLDAQAEGRAGVDARLQPVAEGRIKLRNGTEAVAALASAGFLAPGQALASRAALGLLSRPAPGGGPPEAELPFTLRDGILTVAGIPLARVAVPGWPGN